MAIDDLLDDDEYEWGCGCLACESKSKHLPGKCNRPGVWYIVVHLVDNCSKTEDGSTKAVVCQPCFDALVEMGKLFVHWGMTEVRAPHCLDCGRSITRLHHVIEEVATP